MNCEGSSVSEYFTSSWLYLIIIKTLPAVSPCPELYLRFSWKLIFKGFKKEVS